MNRPVFGGQVPTCSRWSGNPLNFACPLADDLNDGVLPAALKGQILQLAAVCAAYHLINHQWL